ncbi:MAG: hypothetical protein HRU29_11580 [Rhizobiales bacterium]|nr:hypothetical protein [Hyphomicrobiales bacterium]NRB15030.1 hypothetical protein [Hyphomicrobiales bacterium]
MVEMVSDAGVKVKAEKELISIQDLLVWAVRDQCVMKWLDAEHDRIGGLRSQLGALILQCELGGKVDGGGSSPNERMPDDAMRVGFAIDGLGRDDKRLIIEHAWHGDQPLRPTGRLVYVNSEGRRIGVADGKVIDREYRTIGGVRTRVRLKYCRVEPVLSQAEMFYYKPIYNQWVKALEKCIDQLTDLTQHFIDVNKRPKIVA